MFRIVALIAAALTLAACQTASGGRSGEASGPPNSIEVVLSSTGLFYSIEDGGTGRFKSGDSEDWTFPTSHDDYLRIRRLLETYRAEGQICDAPTEFTSTDGHMLWRDERGEVRRRLDMGCNGPLYLAASQNANSAWREMGDWARARWTPPPGLPAPTTMTLVWRSWGARLVEWTLPRGGEGRYIDRDGATTAFPVSVEQFDRFRALFAPYEGVKFECRRVITDGAYGSVIWSQPGHEDQSLNFDAGCVSGDAGDVFMRLEQAETMLNEFKAVS
jgi:hypothetical protein